MVTLEQFVKYIKHIEEQLEKDDKLTELLCSEDTSGWVSTSPFLIDDVLELINLAGIDDKAESISWYLWELPKNKETGEREHGNVWVKDKDGVSYKYTIKDAEDLYYLLLEEYDKIKTKVKEDSPRKGDMKAHTAGVTTLYDIFVGNMYRKADEEK